MRRCAYVFVAVPVHADGRHLPPRVPNRFATRSASRRRTRTTSRSRRSIPTGGQPQVELIMAVWTPGSYLVREYERHVEGVTATAADGRALAVGEVGQEPLAGRDRRRAGGHRELPRLRPRDDGAQQLGRSRLRDAERRADLHHAGRSARRGRTRCASSCRPAGRARRRRCCRSPASRTPIAPRTSTRWSTARSSLGNPVVRELRRRRQAPSPGARRRPVALRRRSRRRRRAEDRRGRRGGDGRRSTTRTTTSSTWSSRPAAGSSTRTRSSPCRTASSTRTRGPYVDWLEPGRARVLPQLERQAAAAGRSSGRSTTRTRTTPRACGSPRASPTTTPRCWCAAPACSTRDEYLDELSGSDRGGADHARAAGAVGRDGVVRHLDQAVPSRREQRQHHASTTTTRAPSSPSCSTRRIRKATSGARSLDDAMRLAYAALLGRQGLHARGVLAGDERDGGRRPVAVVRPGARPPPRSSTSPRRSTGSACASRRSIRAASAPTTGLATRNDNGRLVVTGGASRHPGLRGRPQRGRRDPGDRRPARPRRRPGGAAGPVPAGRHGRACWWPGAIA